MLRQLFFLSCFFLLSACSSDSGRSSDQVPQHQLTGTPLEVSNKVVQSVNQVFSSNADISLLTTFFDKQGVRFAPYYYLTVNDLILNAADVKADWVAAPPTLRTWGEMDGSGEAIELSLRDYFSRFVWDFPYHTDAKVTLIRADADFSSRGNTINNVLKNYPMPQYRVIEYHQPGTNPDFSGMDWSSLMVVIKDLGSQQWSLVALIHGRWTI